jgi:hypothetical protein
LNRNLSHEDSEEIRKGIKSVEMVAITGMITGSGQISLLSGRIRCYRVRFGFATCVRSDEAGWAEPGIRPKSLRKLENPFSFSKLFYKLQTNLNSNQI